MIACWLATTGVIHFVIEGWVVVKADFFQDTSSNYLSATWKEYAKADSRYATRDSFIISMEAVTAFAWGPLCWVAVHGIFNARPWRYTLLVIVSLGQIYGDVLYYCTCYHEGAWGVVDSNWGTAGVVDSGQGSGRGGFRLPCSEQPTLLHLCCQQQQQLRTRPYMHSPTCPLMQDLCTRDPSGSTSGSTS